MSAMIPGQGVRIDGIEWQDDGTPMTASRSDVLCDDGQRSGMFQDIVHMDGVWGDVTSVHDLRAWNDRVG